MSKATEFKVAAVKHELFFDTETRRYRSTLNLVSKDWVDDQGVALRMAALTAIIQRQLDKANQVIDDQIDMNEIKESTDGEEA